MKPGHAGGERSASPPASAAVAVHLIAALVRVDARRPASWLAMAAAGSGLVLVLAMPQRWAVPLAWANGVVAALVAIGHVPAGAGLVAGLAGERRLAIAWTVARAGWPLLGLVLGGLASPHPTAVVVVITAAAGVTAASLAVAVCRGRGCSTADAVSGLLGVTVVAVGVTAGVLPHLPAIAQGLFLMIWTTLAVLLAATSVSSDRSATLPREVTAGSGPLGHAPLRRWYDRLLMVGALLGMVGWLLATEPHVALYGMVAALCVASLVFPEVLLAPEGTASAHWTHLAWQEGRRMPRWRALQPMLLAAVVTGWPLLIATVLVPATRGSDAVLAVGGLACVMALAGAGRAALVRQRLAGETVFAAATLLVWLAAVAISQAFLAEMPVPVP